MPNSIVKISILMVSIEACIYALTNIPLAHADNINPGQIERLTLEHAIELAIRNNISIQLAKADNLEAQGKVLETASALLPNFLGIAAQRHIYQQTFASTAQPDKLTRPFNEFETRAQFVQPIFAPAFWSRWRSAQSGLSSTEYEIRLAEEQVAAAAALAYVEALRAKKAIQSAKADVDLAHALVTEAREWRRVGTATAIDITRAESREADQQLRVLEAESTFVETELRLEYIIGMPFGEPIEFVETLGAPEIKSPNEQEAISNAIHDRLELKIYGEKLEEELHSLTAAREDRLPILVANGEVGASGALPYAHLHSDTNFGPPMTSGPHVIGDIGATLQIPIFTGGLLTARIQEAISRRDAALARLNDSKSIVEEDIRLAIDQLRQAVERVSISELALSLARKEVRLTRERFLAGIGDNIELMEAQTRLADTTDIEVAALARLHIARINYALALGRMKEFKF